METTQLNLNMSNYWSVLQQSTRPNRYETSKYEQGKNDPKYHLDYGRYCIFNGNNTLNTTFNLNAYVNRSFWLGNQWICEEDLEAFLKDDSGTTRNRIRVIRNFIRSNVSVFVGNAERMDLSCSAKSLSYAAINRREQKLNDLLTWTDIANGSDPGFKEYLKEKMPIGDTKEQTAELFENVWTDEYAKTINHLLEYVSTENKFKQKQSEVALDLALTGLGILKYSIHNMDQVWKRIVPERFIFDRSAVEYDLSDAEYMGEYDMLLPSDIFEEAQDLDESEKKAIESTCVARSNNRVPVYRMYWKDFEKKSYGWVRDEFGYTCFVELNKNGKNKYSDSDLIPTKELSEEQLKVTRGKNKRDMFIDMVRFINFIPMEIIAATDKYGTDKVRDIILDYGIMPYQDTEYLKVSNCKFPYKTYCWEYTNGNVSTPITQLINPQRMINRLSSVQENLFSTATPATVAIDPDMVDQKEGMTGLMRDRYQGKFISVKTRGRGMHNATAVLPGSLDNSVALYDNAIINLKGAMDGIVGMNDAIRGEGGTSDQLVGVTAMQIQRASIQQEPFYKALANIFEQAYQSISNVGKRIFIDNDRKIPIMVGDEGAKILTLSKDFESEDFRTFVNRDFNRQTQIENANNVLINMLDRKMIDQNTYADNYGRITMDEIGSVVRKSAKAMGLVAKQQYEIQQQSDQAENEMLMQQQVMSEEKDNERYVDSMANSQAERENKTSNAIIKASAGRKNL